ncbi:RDD family protein [Carboxylicivirga marina]|uniref:RDD family protein n=1 Tax=Carboxylicivirga marina TaxID=2800988 RepID=A0ABS1HRI2_9BACT|nr:RDD family protein [Carboxylicivirga marina]MBK3519784.1 RDD family protein [Carboxylicivirga marina]
MNAKIELGTTSFFVERLLAGIIDVSIVLGLSLFPRIGWIFGLIYFLFKDSLPFLKGQSFGRRLFKIKVVSNADDQSLVTTPDKALIRQIVFLVPLLNLVEIFYFLFKKERLGAIWTSTKVIMFK